MSFVQEKALVLNSRGVAGIRPQVIGLSFADIERHGSREFGIAGSFRPLRAPAQSAACNIDSLF